MEKITEDTITEQPVIEWLRELGYDYEFGPDISPGCVLNERDNFDEVILEKRLKRALEKLNPDLDSRIINEAVRVLQKTEHPNIDLANHEIYKLLTQGIKVEAKSKEGERKGRIVKVFDFEDPYNNEFLVVNQFAIQGIENLRRPDVIVFVNGLPLVIFELKSPTNEDGTVRSAYKQLLETYKTDIPDIFKYNQFLVVSDLIEAKHGTLTSPFEWFSSWKGIENEEEKHGADISRLEILIKGMFDKARLIDLIKNFIIFEIEEDKVAKKMSLYHQFFGVNKAVEETLRAGSEKGDKKVGVFWHTQGSGKTLSMVFYLNKTRQLKELKNPTYLFLTDRNDLDDQFLKTFLRSGYPNAKQAESISDLKKKLKTPAGDIIFTTIQKFADKIKYPKLSDRRNIIVVADEAHRSQYAKLAGNVRTALPNASFMGITGTPISMNDKDTRLVFGDYITQYKINQAVDDGATVKIYYEGRLVPLHLSNEYIDEEFEDLMAEQEFEIKQKMKQKWSRLEQAVGANERLQQIAEDIVEHYNTRGLEGKAMIVTMSRRIAVDMYKLITAQPGAPETAVVLSQLSDFKDEIQKELKVSELDRRFKDPKDPLKIVIVCDMWLTGFDVPALHTMYIDKPLKNHTLMQAIARVNRIYKDKEGGLIVDYIGIADNLKKSLSIYSSDVQEEALVPLDEAISKMMEKYDIVKTYFTGIEFENWKQITVTDRTRLFQNAVNNVLTNPDSKLLDEGRQERYLNEATQLFKLFALVSPHKSANKIRNEVEFFQAVKKAVVKRTVSKIKDISEDVDSAARELISKAIAAEGVIDIFQMQGKAKPEISIFDEKFIEEVKKMKYKNLAIQTLRKLLNDEIKLRKKKNVIRYQSLLALLQEIIEQYENNIINSGKVIEKLIELAKEIKQVEKAGEDLGLSEEELAFYDALSKGKKAIKGDEELKSLVKEIVKSIKRDLTVDWTNNEVIQARIKANVKRMLVVKKVERQLIDNLVENIYHQAFNLYKDYVPERI